MPDALIATRLVQFAVAMHVLGGSVFHLYISASLAQAPGIGEAFDGWLRKLHIAGAILVLLSAAVWLDFEAVAMGSGWVDALDARTIAAVLFETEFGGAWIWHLAIAALLLVVLLVAPVRRAPIARVLVAGLSVALMPGLAWAGHAVMASGATRLVHLTVQVVHLFAGSLWLGSLLPLAYLLGRAHRDPAGPWGRVVRAMLPRYARFGYLAVGLILVTGCINSWFLVGSPAALVNTAFGQVLLVKIGLFLLMVAGAAVNRLHLAPAVLAAPSGGAPIRSLSRIVAVEQALGLLVLGAVSLLGMLPPAMAH